MGKIQSCAGYRPRRSLIFSPQVHCSQSSFSLSLKALLRGSLTFALALSLVLSPLSAIYADQKQDISNSQKKIDSMQQEKAELEQAMKKLGSLQEDAKAYISEMDRQLSSLDEQLTQLARQISDKEAQLKETGEMLTQAQANEAEQYASMKTRIRYMYEKGDTSFIDMILNAGSWKELLNRAEYIKKISSYDRQKLEEYKETRDRVAETRKRQETEKAELLALQEATRAKQSSVQTLMKKKQQELSVYQQQFKDAQNKVSGLNADIQAQEAHIEAIEAEIRRREEEARKKAAAEGKQYTQRTLKGGLSWPLPSSSRVTSGFGARTSPTEGASSYHKGIDISAPVGSAVVAAAAGEVVIATYSASAGNYVMINHGSGIYTVYMHLSSISVSQGESVSQGQKVGGVGSTGYSTGPHLHFGVRKNGSYVDPLSYVG